MASGIFHNIKIKIHIFGNTSLMNKIL